MAQDVASRRYRAGYLETRPKPDEKRQPVCGWRVEHVSPRFLPLSMRSRRSSLSFLVPWYLRPPIKPVAGQVLVVARRPLGLGYPEG